jgi:hypothetical protein
MMKDRKILHDNKNLKCLFEMRQLFNIIYALREFGLEYLHILLYYQVYSLII